MWRGDLGGTYRLPALSSAGASLFPPCFRFHTPLIEPDRRILRIRLSGKVSRCRPWKAGGLGGKSDQSKLTVQGLVRITLRSGSLPLVFGTQPLTQPLAGMSFHSPIGFADWSKAEVVRPSKHHAVELPYHLLMVQQSAILSGHVAHRRADALNALL